MSDTKIRAKQLLPRRVQDGKPIEWRGTRDGTAFTADWLTALALEGRCFAVEHGTGTDPVALTGAYVAATPDLYVRVADATVVLPLYMRFSFEDSIAASAIPDFIAVASGATTTAGSGTTLTIVNMRTDAPKTTSCTAWGTITGGATTPATGNYYEFWRPIGGALIDSVTAAAGGYNYSWAWNVRKASAPPVIVGDGSLMFYGCDGTNAIETFVGAQWAEIPESNVI